MVNLIEFTLKSEQGERYLAISPILLHIKELPSLKLPFKGYLYEGLITQDSSSLFGEEESSISRGYAKKLMMLKPGQDLEKAYLGYLVKPSETAPWQHDGSLKNLTADEIEQLEQLINNYQRPGAD